MITPTIEEILDERIFRLARFYSALDLSGQTRVILHDARHPGEYIKSIDITENEFILRSADGGVMIHGDGSIGSIKFGSKTYNREATKIQKEEDIWFLGYLGRYSNSIKLKIEPYIMLYMTTQDKMKWFAERDFSDISAEGMWLNCYLCYVENPEYNRFARFFIPFEKIVPPCKSCYYDVESALIEYIQTLDCPEELKEVMEVE